ncbi:MAG: hypothetical protein ACI841_002589, partial [Planctomycetota bacterium]
MIETVLLLGLLIGVSLPILLRVLSGRATPVRAGAFASWALGLAAVAWAAGNIEEPAPVLDRPIEVNSQGYVSSNACQSCHPGEYASWHRSYHRTMTQAATVSSIAGPLDEDVVLETRGQTVKVMARGDEVWAEMDDPSHPPGQPGAPRIERKVVMTTGSHEQQFFWTSMGDRKMSLLPVMYRMNDEQRWAQLDGCCVTPPTSVQENENARWNRVCNRCHSTHTSPRIDETGEAMDTHSVELGIACEACHGPGGEHVAVNQDPRRRYKMHTSGDADDTITNPNNLDHELSSYTCAQCHSTAGFIDNEEYFKWKELGYSYRPGDDLFDTRSLYTEGDDKFWADGMVRVSGREFSGMRLSPCYLDGTMSCTSCHEMHPSADDPRSLDEWADDMLYLGMDGNHACTQCHSEYLEGGAVTAHSHHGADSTGSECMNCHMPYTTYGLLKGMRSHQVSNPSIQESINFGRPNACNQCHLDKTLEWAGEKLEEWYGIQPPATLTRDQKTIAASILWTLEGDPGQRALMAWSYGWESARNISGTSWMTPMLIALMRDSYHASRYIAARSFEKQPEAKTIEYDFMGPMESMIARTNPAFEAWARGAS